MGLKKTWKTMSGRQLSEETKVHIATIRPWRQIWACDWVWMLIDINTALLLWAVILVRIGCSLYLYLISAWPSPVWLIGRRTSCTPHRQWRDLCCCCSALLQTESGTPSCGGRRGTKVWENSRNPLLIVRQLFCCDGKITNPRTVFSVCNYVSTGTPLQDCT